jgi:hypothetical protein
MGQKRGSQGIKVGIEDIKSLIITGDHWTIIQKLKQVQNNMINYIYLPPEQRPTVTAISTKLRQLEKSMSN